MLDYCVFFFFLKRMGGFRDGDGEVFRSKFEGRGLFAFITRRAVYVLRVAGGVV